MKGEVKTKEKEEPTAGIPTDDLISEMMERAKDPYSMFTVEAAKEILAETRRFIKVAFKKGVDYEVRRRSGQQEESLLKPGAEKLALKFKLRPEFHLQESPVLDWERQLFYFPFVCTLIHIPSGKEVAQYVASCNSWEENYRYRWLTAKQLPPGTDKDDLPSKEKGGYSGSPKYTVFRMDNLYIPDQINTVVQMAQKRAFVGCVRLATQTSDRFTQDDGSGNGPSETDAGRSQRAAASPAPTKKALAGTQNLKDELYKHFAGDEEAVQNFLRETIKASGKIPLEMLTAAKVRIIRDALEAEKRKKKDDGSLPF